MRHRKHDAEHRGKRRDGEHGSTETDDSGAEQASPEMKVVSFSCTVGEPDRFKRDVFKLIQTINKQAELDIRGVEY